MQAWGIEWYDGWYPGNTDESTMEAVEDVPKSNDKESEDVPKSNESEDMKSNESGEKVNGSNQGEWVWRKKAWVWVEPGVKLVDLTTRKKFTFV